jgi:hypothetical protein
MKTVDSLVRRFSDRLEPINGRAIWQEWDFNSKSWWASLKPGWRCARTEAGSCHEKTLRELSKALKEASLKEI